MKKVNFTQDFYKKVYDALCEYCKEYYEGDKNCMSVSTITVDGYEIECDADVDTEWRDDSFDHAFGTWRDPYAGYEFSDVSGIDCVTVWDENGDEVDGFSIDDYEAQFIEDEYAGIKKGDKVFMYIRGRYSEDTAEVLYYNNRIDEFVVKVGNYNRTFSRYHLKKAA